MNALTRCKVSRVTLCDCPAGLEIKRPTYTPPTVPYIELRWMCMKKGGLLYLQRRTVTQRKNRLDIWKRETFQLDPSRSRRRPILRFSSFVFGVKLLRCQHFPASFLSHVTSDTGCLRSTVRRGGIYWVNVKGWCEVKAKRQQLSDRWVY